MRYLLSHCRTLPSDVRDDAVSVRSLSAFEPNTLLEIVEAKEVTDAEFGKHFVAVYSYTRRDKSRRTGRVRLPDHVVKSAPTTPYLGLYLGKRENKGGKEYHDMATFRPSAEGTLSPAQLRQYAEELQALGPDAINKRMIVQTLDAFDAGTVFLFKEVEKRKMRAGMEECLVVAFETEREDGKTLSGRLFVPIRCESELRKRGSGVMLYRGKKESARTAGRFYNDLVVVDDQVLSNIM